MRRAQHHLCHTVWSFQKLLPVCTDRLPWLLQTIHGDAPVVPEREEYGISSFVYCTPSPLHPQRLFTFINLLYTLQEEMQDDDDDDVDDVDDNGDKDEEK